MKSIALTPPAETDQKTSITVAYYLSFIIIGMATAIMGPTLPDLAEKTGSSLGNMSILFSTRSLGYLIGALMVGRLYDKGAGHRLMAAMLFLTAVLFTFVPLCNFLILLAVLFLLLGLTESMVDIGGNTFLVWLHREKIAPYMNGLHFFFGVGGFIAPLIVAFALTRFGDTSWSFWILAAMISPIAIWLYKLPSPQPKIQTRKNEAKLNKTEKQLFSCILVFILLYVSIEFGYGSWIYSYALTAELADKTSAAFLTSLFWASFTLSRLASIPIAMRFKPITILLTAMSGSLCFFTLILIFPTSMTILIAGSAGIGVFLAPVFPTIFTFCERRLGITGKRTSYFFIGGSIGIMTLPWLFGQLLEKQGTYSMMIAMTFTTACALSILLGIYFFFIRKMDKAE